MKELALSLLIGVGVINALLLTILLHTLLAHRDIFLRHVFPPASEPENAARNTHHQENLRILLYYGARVCAVITVCLVFGVSFCAVRWGVAQLV